MRIVNHLTNLLLPPTTYFYTAIKCRRLIANICRYVKLYLSTSISIYRLKKHIQSTNNNEELLTKLILTSHLLKGSKIYYMERMKCKSKELFSWVVYCCRF